MGSRTTARRIAMQAIFQSEASQEDIKKSLEDIFAEEKITDDTRKFTTKIALGASSNKEELDAKITVLAKNWSIDRINLVNKSILRLALYELIYEKDVPKAVVINEALELAKRYSDEESAKFINGVLGSVVI